MDQIAKTIVFTNQNDSPLIAVIRGDFTISRHKLERCSKSKSVRLVSDEFAESVTGFPKGGIPPLGHRKKIPVFVDSEITSHEYVWCGGGTRSKLVRLKPEDIIRLNSASGMRPRGMLLSIACVPQLCY